MVQYFFEDMLSRNAENKNAKSKQFAVKFSRFWEAEIMIFGDFWRSELRFFVILEVRGPILRILWIFVFPGTKKEPPGTKKESQNYVIFVCEVRFFECCVFF